MSIERRVALIALILSALILWAALAPLNRSVYLFPIFWASFMVVLSIVLLWRTFPANRHSDSERPGAGTLPMSQAILRLAPAIGVFVSYLFLMANLGFYVSAWLAFVALACWYGPRPVRFAGLLTHGAIGAVFATTLYLLFSYLLAVQPPGGWLF
jgi:hypothetical protein